MSFMSIWMILWFVTLITSSFSQRTWRTLSTIYVWFWRSINKLNFYLPNWRNVNSTNLKWNYWVTSCLEMTFAWILIKFRPLLIRLLHLLFEMFNDFLNLPTFINVSLFFNNGPSYSVA
jgi:hypothetical protein